MFLLLIFTSISYANSDNLNETIQNEFTNDNIESNAYQEKNIDKKLEKNEEKSSDANKHTTSSTLDTYTNGSHIIMNSTVKSDINVNTGYVIYKLNGATLKENNENIKVNVVNSKAILALSVSEYTGLYSTSEVVYSGSDEFTQSRKLINNTKLIKHDTTTSLNTYTNDTHVIMKATVKSDIPIYNGYVIYKLNQLTLKDSYSAVYKVYVSDSTAILSLPISDYRRILFNQEAVYSGSNLFRNSRTFVNKTMNLRLNPKMNVKTDQSTYYAGDKITFMITISDKETNNFNNGRVLFKLNGVTLKDKNNNPVVYRINGNQVNASIQIPKGIRYDHINITVLSDGFNYNTVKSINKISLKPMNTHITVNKFYIDNNNNCIVNAVIKDKDDETVIGSTYLDFLVDNNKLRINNVSKVYKISNGQIKLEVPLDYYPKGIHNLQLKLRTTYAYNSSASQLYKISLTEKYPTKIIIDTPQKAQNASQSDIRIYVTYANQSLLKTVNQGRVIVKINNNTLTSRVNYGKAIISYKLPSKVDTYLISVDYEGDCDLKDSHNSKNIILTSGSISNSESAILGNKNPTQETIPLVGGIPNLIYMTNYVWADENGTYTLTKNQLEEVFKQDSYSLYLNRYMSKYVAFKTANESNIYHVLKREKWNVIEKEVNKIRVKSAKGTIPNNITVNLKGKSYTYSEARAIQSTGYTCGPTATSVCTQSLRNYVNEYTLATEFKTYTYTGTYARYIDPALKKHNMTAVYYYKNTFDKALEKVANGGYTFVFYGVNHYVSIIDVSKDKSKVLVSNSYGNYSLGGGKIPNGWVSVSLMKNRFSSDSFAGLLISLQYSLSSTTKTRVNNLYNNFGSTWIRQNTNEELNV